MARLKTFPPRSTDSRQPPLGRIERGRKLRHGFHLLVVDADDDIAALDAEPRRRCLVLDVEHHDALAHVVDRCRLPRPRRARDWRPCSRSTDGGLASSRASRGGSSTGAISAMLVLICCPLRNTPSSVAPPMPLVSEAVLEGLRILHRLVVDADHHVAGSQTRLRPRGPWREPWRPARLTASSSPSDSAMSGVTLCSAAPSQGRCTLPPVNAD